MKKDNLRIDNVLDKSLKGWLPVKDITGKDYKLFYSTSVEKTKSKKYLIVTEGEAKNKTVSIEYLFIFPSHIKSCKTNRLNQIFTKSISSFNSRYTYFRSFGINAGGCFKEGSVAGNSKIKRDGYFR